MVFAINCVLVLLLIGHVATTDRKPTDAPKPTPQADPSKAEVEKNRYQPFNALDRFLHNDGDRLYVRQDYLVIWMGCLTVLLAICFICFMLYCCRYQKDKNEFYDSKNKFNHEGQLTPQRSNIERQISSPIFCTNLADQEFMRLANGGSGVTTRYIKQ